PDFPKRSPAQDLQAPVAAGEGGLGMVKRGHRLHPRLDGRMNTWFAELSWFDRPSSIGPSSRLYYCRDPGYDPRRNRRVYPRAIRFMHNGARLRQENSGRSEKKCVVCGAWCLMNGNGTHRSYRTYASQEHHPPLTTQAAWQCSRGEES